MSNAKPYPGPYTANLEEHNCSNDGSRYIVAPDPVEGGKRRIATVESHIPRKRSTPYNAPDAERDATALLLAAAPDLLAAATKAQAFIDDLHKSNPGFIKNLVLQDYKNYNELLGELPRAIAAETGGAK